VATAKVSITLDAELLQQARVHGATGGLSATVNEALRVYLQGLRVDALLADMEQEFGAVPEEMLEQARQELKQLTGKQGSGRRSA